MFHRGKYAPERDDEYQNLDGIPELTMLGNDDPDDQLLTFDDNLNDAKLIDCVISLCQPYPGDNDRLSNKVKSNRFQLEREGDDVLCIYDRANLFEACISLDLVSWTEFSIAKWFAEQCAFNIGSSYPWEDADLWMKGCEWHTMTMRELIDNIPINGLSLRGIQVD